MLDSILLHACVNMASGLTLASISFKKMILEISKSSVTCFVFKLIFNLLLDQFFSSNLFALNIFTSFGKG